MPLCLLYARKVSLRRRQAMRSDILAQDGGWCARAGEREPPRPARQARLAERGPLRYAASRAPVLSAQGMGAMKLAFADCVLDLAARQLSRAGRVLPLEPKMFELLEVLIQRRPAVVKNEELDEILWPKVYVARTSLTRLVSELRSALGDTPRDSKIIRTVYKSGYAFDAAVSILSAPTPLAPPAFTLVWNDKSFPLIDGEHIAGRGDECELVIDAETVSRRHARIIVRGASASIEDLDSTNGTSVSGIRISAPTALVDGNQIALGTAKLVIRKRDPSKETVKVSDGDRDRLVLQGLD
jgi:DNA-binding winged helix-turn-helix (wHTH) protein